VYVGTKPAGTAPTGAITVDPTKIHQVVDGFGLADVWQGSSSATMQTLLWDPVNGIGLNLLRIGIDGTSGKPNIMGAAGYADGQACVKFAGSACKVWAAPWSPPASMKDNNNEQRWAFEFGQLCRVGRNPRGISRVLQAERRRGSLRHVGPERA
jgi:O-glycosyl hydrolase